MISCPALQMEVGRLSSAEDLEILQNHRRDVALGIADGVAAWSRAVNTASERDAGNGRPMAIGINVNGGLYDEAGLMINDNAYVPVDLVEQFNLDLDAAVHLKRMRFGKRGLCQSHRPAPVQHFGEMGSRNPDGTVALSPGATDRSRPGRPHHGAGQLPLRYSSLCSLKAMNEKAVSQFPDLAKNLSRKKPSPKALTTIWPSARCW